ncbi:RING finger protein B [Fulvia fulva]|uniref:RING finger protein B n=1 Tax=Passalora fulva TaxID=5499 RepID=A0A9Q8LDW7_PASFU|nr:RING finger protein B [Fulvia fulva]KAK4627077.1 RING finger protein B [Fulvia fulva]KAK4627831.1 RING finger protein B [Fulvia fulva]UJO15741.1 RING finger protein B [Fulvia fulva]WPV13589.1 RING finger protein B [Fulvia fulva]WPV28810.1 RING finger protein B [Fulvia fulva]
MASTTSTSNGRVSNTSNNTYVMSRSPVKNSRRRTGEPYLPKIITTVGQRPACLVNASVTYVGNDLIYAFGGFDQYTDEVYNHVLKLNLSARQWSLVDNYGDIPGVRMGHTSCLWQGDKLLVFGGENEHRKHLSDLVIFDIKTAHWTQPEISGPIPRGRARHSAVIHDDKLFICGGMSGCDNNVLDDICYLDLKTWTWSRTWRLVPRFDHSSWVWGGKIWISGGMGEEMERTSEIWWLDFRGTPAFEGGPTYGLIGSEDARPLGERYASYSYAAPSPPMGTGYAANTGSVQSNTATQIQRAPPVAPGAISSVKFISSPNLPMQNVGTHFHVFSSGCMLDFVTPATNMPLETSLSALDLDSLRWQKLADGKDLFSPTYRWHYCCLDADGTHAWLLGCPRELRAGGNGEAEEYLSDVLPIDLRKFGLLGNKMSQEARNEQRIPTSDSNPQSHLSAIGADLARTFNQPPESGSGTDFTITALKDDVYDMEPFSDDDPLSPGGSATGDGSNASQPIHVHRLILSARWPHFSRLYNAQMSEFHTRRMHIPEPYPAVKAFLYYLYTDSISSPPAESQELSGPTLEDVANMLVMSNIYDMPRLRHLCVNRLVRDLDVQHAALIFDRASTAQEDWLKRRAASFCMTHWGRIVRTDGFRRLKRSAMLELCEGVDAEGRVVGGDELEAVGGLGGARLGSGMGVLWGNGRKRNRLGSTSGTTVDGDGDDADADLDADDEGMELS